MNSFNAEKKLTSSGAEFHQSLASSWSSGYGGGGFRRRIDFFRGRLREVVRPGDRWLDAGCGSGVLSRELSYFGAEVVGVDGSPKMIQAANLETDESHGSVVYKVVTTIENLGEPSEVYDGILCSSVIEYVDHPERVFEEFFRVTKAGGVVLFSVPNMYSPLRILQSVIRFVGKGFGKEYYRYLTVSKQSYSARSIRDIVEHKGFAVDQVDQFDPLFRWLPRYPRLGSLLLITAHKTEINQD